MFDVHKQQPTTNTNSYELTIENLKTKLKQDKLKLYILRFMECGLWVGRKFRLNIGDAEGGKVFIVVGINSEGGMTARWVDHGQVTMWYLTNRDCAAATSSENRFTFVVPNQTKYLQFADVENLGTFINVEDDPYIQNISLFEQLPEKQKLEFILTQNDSLMNDAEYNELSTHNFPLLVDNSLGYDVYKFNMLMCKRSIAPSLTKLSPD